MKRKIKPLVSIGLATYNSKNRIDTALKSLFSQTYKNIEIIISDNCSSDGTDKICIAYSKKDARIKYYRQVTNIGILNNFNFVLKRARGNYFMWASDDDDWNKDFILTLKKALETHPDHGVAMSSVSGIDEKGLLVDKILLTGKNNLTNLGYISVARKLLMGIRIHLYIYGLFRTNLINQLMSRPFPQCIAGDRVLMTELSLITHFYSTDRMLFSKTISKESIASRYSNEKLGQEWKSPTKHLYYIYSMFSRLFTSPLIPFSRKIKIIPHLILFAFLNFYHIILDLIPFKKFLIASYRKLKINFRI